MNNNTMNNTMFASLIEKPRATQKWLLFPLSLLLHGAVIAGVLVAPLLSDSVQMPELKFVSVSLMATPPEPPSPPKSSSSRRAQRNEASQEREATPKPMPTSRFVAPIEIPDDIEPEDSDSFFGDTGDTGEYIPGAEYGPIDVETFNSGFLKKDTSDSSSSKMMPSRVTPPRLIRKIAPTYPPVAQNARIQGNVLVEAVTDIYGKVMNVRIISGHPLLQSAAIQAVKQWIYEPYIINGYPKAVVFTVAVNFQLNR